MFWLRKPPTKPGFYWHRNLENAGGRAPIEARVMYVGYVNWTEDPAKGHGTKPTPYMPPRLRAVRAEHPLTTDALTVQEWAGCWRGPYKDAKGVERFEVHRAHEHNEVKAYSQMCEDQRGSP